MTKHSSLFFAAAVAGLAALGIAVEAVQRSAYSVEDGANYLKDKGYTNVNGGTRDYFNMCGKGVFARSYIAHTTEGKKVAETVCFSPIWGRYRPIL